MMKTLRVAIIGQGRSGRGIHAKHIVTQPRKYRIVVAVDPIKERREWAAANLGCDVHATHKPVLKRNDIDLVVNATPSPLHGSVSCEFLKAGFNVLCEKPLARTVREADRVIAAAKKSGKVFAIYQQSRFAAYYRQVAKVVQSGVLGRVVQISIAFNGFARRWDWQTLTERYGGNLLNTGPHPLDQALRFLDIPVSETPEVFCHMDRAHFCGNAEGHVNLILRAPGRPLINLEISSCCTFPCYTYNLYGTQGGLKGGMSEMAWRYFKPSEAPKRRALTTPLRDKDGVPIYCGESLKWYEKKWTVPPSKRDLFAATGAAFYNNLYNHMTKGEPLEVTPDQVRQQIAVIEECHRQNPNIWGNVVKRGRKR